MRDFTTKYKDEITFVYNLHCAGNQLILPFNGEFPNHMSDKFPDLFSFFQQMTEEENFPKEIEIGAAYESLSIIAGGEASDWMTSELQIPAVDFELLSWNDIDK